jgi:hypothetical protein
MAPRYYTTPGLSECIDDLVHQIEKHPAGELYVANHFRGIKIIYDVNTGFLATQNVDTKPGINESYNPKILNPILQPIVLVFGLLAKVELIRSLQQLGDHKVANLIEQNQFDEKIASGKLSHSYLEQLFKKISQLSAEPGKSTLLPDIFFKPKHSEKPNVVQRAIRDVFAHLERDEHGMLKLESKQRVVEIIEAIKIRAAELTMYETSKPLLSPKYSR